MHPCDITTLERIAELAPHMLTAEDRQALRLHRSSPTVRRVSFGLVLDSVKTLAYHADRLACDSAFAALQAFNLRHKKHLRALSA
jgi:hypothetical protein